MTATVRGRLALAGAIAFGLAGVALAGWIAAGDTLLAERWHVARQLTLWWLVFAAGAACALAAPRRATRTVVAVIVVLAVAMRLAALADGPRLSDDHERYSWDGRVQAHGIDPYRHPPSAPELARLRVPALWPPIPPADIDRDCIYQKLPDAPGSQRGCTRINRPRVRTIYPPLAEAWFVAGYAIGGTGSATAVDRTWQIAALLADLACLAVLLALLRDLGRDPRWLVLYAWCPLVVNELAQNAHVDGLGVLLALGALWALQRRRPALAGALIGGAILVKLYPAVLLAALCRDPLHRPRAAAVALASALAVTAAAYVPHVLAVGPRVLGYLQGYLEEEQYGEGTRFLLLGALGLTGDPAKLAVLVILATVTAFVTLGPGAGARPPDQVASVVLGTALLLATPVQPWYGVLLVAVAAVGGAWWWLGVAGASYVVFFATVLGDDPTTSGRDLGRLAFAVALAVVLAVAAITARRARRGLGRTPAR